MIETIIIIELVIFGLYILTQWKWGNKMIECNQCNETVSHHHYLKFDDVTYYFCENCYFEYMDESEVTNDN